MSANNPMSFYSENVDAWGPLEWFDRLAKAVHARSQTVRDKDDIAFETYQNIASSSATRLVSDFEDKVRMALTTLRELEKANIAYVDANTELVSTLESLQRENEALKKDRDFWKEQFQVETRYRIELADRGTLLALTDANSRAEAAEAEAKMLREALHKIESGYGANDICARIARDALSAQVQDVAGWQTRRPQQFLDKYPDASEYVMHLHETEREARIAGLPNSAMVNGNFPEDAIASVTVRAVFAAAPAKQEGGHD